MTDHESASNKRKPEGPDGDHETTVTQKMQNTRTNVKDHFNMLPLGPMLTFEFTRVNTEIISRLVLVLQSVG